MRPKPVSKTRRELRRYEGGCHCGAVRFEIQAPDPLPVLSCNCSRCKQLGFLHVIVPASRFQLLSGRETLSEYTFNTRTARHLFCSRCGVQSYYVPRSNPDGFSVNARCLDGIDPETLNAEPFDGRNWEQHGASLAALTRE